MCSFISLVTIVIYKYADIATVNVTRSSLSLLCSTLVGFIIFNETITSNKIVRIVLMLMAVFCIFLDGRQQLGNTNFNESSKKNKKHCIVMFVLINLMRIPALCFSAFQNKLVASTNFVPDMNSYFFMTNVFMILFVLIWICFIIRKDNSNVLQCIAIIKSKSFIPIVVLILVGSISAVLNVEILKYMDVSVFSPMSSAFSFIGAAIASIIFKEKIGKWVWCAVALAICAVAFEPLISAIF